MELVEGEDLSQRIARGAIPVDEALPVAKQIAEALEGAHQQGIVHRDLKPANIKLRPDGTVKVLDFGLAKALAPEQDPASGAHRSQSPTITSPAMLTGLGIVLGTAAYMAPEQAKGREADKRSDIWAFGCVLYEMLTGRRPFEGEDMTDVLGAVVRLEPAWEALPSDRPRAGADTPRPMPGQGPPPTRRRYRGRALRTGSPGRSRSDRAGRATIEPRPMARRCAGDDRDDRQRGCRRANVPLRHARARPRPVHRRAA